MLFAAVDAVQFAVLAHWHTLSSAVAVEHAMEMCCLTLDRATVAIVGDDTVDEQSFAMLRLCVHLHGLEGLGQESRLHNRYSLFDN